MSWEAVSWANKQRMKLPQEQLVLLVLANCADPEGVAFSQWRGREHWWKYLVDRTRLSRSSIFRHLSTIEKLGLGQRSTLVLADGTRRPTIHLDLEKFVDEASYDQIDADSDPSETAETDESQSHHETSNPRNPVSP